MEFDNTWTCGCGARNIGDVFTNVCWKCGIDWSEKPLKIETAESLRMCLDCRAMDGNHKIDCPTHPLPKEFVKK